MGRDDGRRGSRVREAAQPTDADLLAPGRATQRQATSAGWPSRARCAGSTNQKLALGLVHARDRTIRLSRGCRAMPAWVIDYVLVHELAHLLEPGHDAGVLGVGRPLPAGRAGQGLPQGWSAAAKLGTPPATRLDDGAARRRRATPSDRDQVDMLRLLGQRVDRPPAHVERLGADRVLGVRRGARHEADVEVVHLAARAAERDGVLVEVHRHRVERRGRRRRTPRSPRAARRRPGSVARLAVAAELEPAPRLRVQGQQHRAAGRRRAPARRR